MSASRALRVEDEERHVVRAHRVVRRDRPLDVADLALATAARPACRSARGRARGRPRRRASQLPQQRGELVRARDDDVGRRRAARAATRLLRPRRALRASRPSTAWNASRSVVSSPATSARRRPASASSRRTAVPLFASSGGSTSRTFRPKRAFNPSARARSATSSSASQRRRLVLRGAEVERDREILQLRVGPPGFGGERPDPRPPLLRLRLDVEAVRADADDAVHADAPADVVAGAAGDDAHERVAAGEPFELRARLGQDGRVVRPVDDRREHAVEVEEERGLAGRRGEALEQRVPRSHAL